MLNRLSVTKWLGLVLVLFSFAALACGAAETEIVTVDKPFEVIREVVKEVPVEKVVIKEVVKEVPKEVVVTKEVVKTVTVDKPITVIKEVVKEVPREVVVVKEVIKTVEVPMAREAKVLKLRYKESIENLSPFEAGCRGGCFAHDLLSARLIFPDDVNLQWSPDLAERWEASADGTSYTFYIRRGAKFHDGVEATAKDVVWSFNKHINPKFNAGATSLAPLIMGGQDVLDGKADTAAGIVLVDDYTVRFDQAFPNALFLDKCCQSSGFTIMPEHILGSVADDKLLDHPFFFDKFIGLGPFMLDIPLEVDVGYAVKKNPDYFLGSPLIDRITFEMMESKDVMFVAMQRGELHGSVYPTLTEEMYKALIADPRFNVIGLEGGILRGFVFNNRFEAALDPRIRQGFLHALDRRALIDAFWAGNGTPLNTPFGNPNWTDPEWDTRYEYNPTKARQLLEEGGWDFNRTVVNITYYVDREDFFGAMQEMLSEVGFKMETQVLNAGWGEAYYEDPYPYELVFAGYGGIGTDPDGILMSQIHSSGRNPIGYARPEMDALIEQGQRGVTVEQRAVAYRQIGMEFANTLPWLPVFRQNEWLFKSNRWYQPSLDRARIATSVGDIEILPVFRGAMQSSKYHPEQWDLLPIGK